MGQERWKELSLGARIESLKAIQSVLTGKVVWWELEDHPAIDRYGGELKKILELGSEVEQFLTPEMVKVREKGSGAVALVLSGGGALMPIEFGAIWALRDAGIPVDIVAGTSGGSVGAVVAAKMNTSDDFQKVEEWIETVNWDDLRTEGVLNEGGWWKLDKLPGFVNEKLAGLSQSDEEIPTLVTMVDISQFPQQRYRVQWQPFEGTTWGEMIQASCSVPVWMTPTYIGGYRLWDGGVYLGEGNEPIEAVKALVPEAMVISVCLSGMKGLRSALTPEIRIEPCAQKRNKLRDIWVFDKRDIVLGYEETSKRIDEILTLMDEREIEKRFLSGFGG